MQRLSEQILAVAERFPQGTSLAAKSLLHLGSRAGMDQALSHLAERGRLIRVGRSVYAKGVYPAKPLIPILGGLLTFESEWSPALGPSFEKALVADIGDRRLDTGCVASRGHFFFDQAAASYTLVNENKPATAFLFKLISQLQFNGTVPMIDVEAYGRWLTK